MSQASTWLAKEEQLEDPYPEMAMVPRISPAIRNGEK
jgi:hypothetical protein